MSEVKRYAVWASPVSDGPTWVEFTQDLRNNFPDAKGYVREEDFDRVTAERDGLQALLTAADERADVLGGLLFSLPEDLKDLSGSENTAGVYACIDYIEQCIAGLQPVSALKPALVTNDEHVCSGCGSKGWTANCAKCVPY